jgi:hypothetical protein
MITNEIGAMVGDVHIKAMVGDVHIKIDSLAITISQEHT